MRSRRSERVASEGRASDRRMKGSAGRAAAALLLLGSLGCSDGGSSGGLFSFARRETPRVDTRLSAGSATDRLVADGESAERVAAFRLTRSRIDRWLEAQEFLSLVATREPEVARIVDGQGSGDPGAQSDAAIDEAIARLEASGPVREALSRVGTSPAEFVLTGLAMHQAFLASTPTAPERLRRLAARNLRVMQRHEALLQRARGGDRLQYAYLDSLGWTAGGDTLAAAGAVYDPWAPDTLAPTDTLAPRDTLTPPDSVPPPLPPLDTLPARPDSARAGALPRDGGRRAPPGADSVRLRPVLPPPAPRITPDSAARRPPPAPALPDSLPRR